MYSNPKKDRKVTYHYFSRILLFYLFGDDKRYLCHQGSYPPQRGDDEGELGTTHGQ